MAQVTLQNVNKVYKNGFHAVQDFSLEIKDGEFMVLVGPSGCAKSTTLRMLAGLESISSGDLMIGDKRCNDIAPKNRGIAMVFQNYALYPHMTVRQNLAFGLETRKKPKDEIDRRVAEAAEMLEITELLERKPGQLSGGQCQRVALGRAMVRKPQVFLFDEPLSNLDAKLRVSMRMRISRLHQQLKLEGRPATMVYVTHDQVEALTMGDRICVMNRGKIMQVDTPMNLYHQPANKFVAEFIGSPSMNMVSAIVYVENGQAYLKLGDTILTMPDEKATMLEGYSGKEVYLGFRPEHITLASEGEESLNVTVTDIEEMGSESFIYYDYQGIQLICKQFTFTGALQTGTKQSVRIDVEKCHLFDKETERNITRAQK